MLKQISFLRYREIVTEEKKEKTVAKRRRRRKRRRRWWWWWFSFIRDSSTVDQPDFVVPFERGFLDIASIDRSIDRVALNVLASDFLMTTLYIFLIELIVSGFVYCTM